MGRFFRSAGCRSRSERDRRSVAPDWRRFTEPDGELKVERRTISRMAAREW
ncbi:hypothetical protein HMPREF3038_01883 [Akkermansia sp. KLE1797]|nr:hypothetical protein HMPREF3038_01883 [Akkermansia sp. KLE1797]KZA05953.1 hypothetical protein HMPREF1326_00215 [Akkermansia sp. KLE1605]